MALPAQRDNAKMSFLPSDLPRRRWLVATLSLVMSGCGRKKAAATAALPAGATVLALGDSITFGTGAETDAAYPARLAALTGWNVINGGIPGDTAAQALDRLPALLAEHKPALVIVSIGGNDFLRRLPESQTVSAIRRTAMLAREAGAQVMLVGVPQPTIGAALGTGLSDHPIYERLADELSLPLHPKGWARVLGDEKLRSDAIHANANGYRAFAEGLAVTLRESKLLSP
jgi:lysophospholipase L1-like esterase